LTSYEEPVWQVIQDMREQRMSLCQSLRQYVFVHAAVIEGALMVVDEEREASGKSSPVTSHGPGRVRVNSALLNVTPGKGKRGASPTELLKKDKKGDVSLAKRPSVKRKSSVAGSSDASFDLTDIDPLDSITPSLIGKRGLSGIGATR